MVGLKGHIYEHTGLDCFSVFNYLDLKCVFLNGVHLNKMCEWCFKYVKIHSISSQLH